MGLEKILQFIQAELQGLSEAEADDVLRNLIEHLTNQRESTKDTLMTRYLDRMVALMDKEKGDTPYRYLIESRDAFEKLEDSIEQEDM